jgi:hypothetical protein
VAGILSVTGVLLFPDGLLLLVSLLLLAFLQEPWCCGISEVPFKLAVAGIPAAIGFLAVDGVLDVASIPVDFGVPIFSWWLYILVQ